MTTISRLVLETVEHHVDPIPVADDRGILGGRTTTGILRLFTDQGAEGQSIVGSFGDNSTWQIDQIRERIGPLLLGRNPSSREWLWNELDTITGHGLPVHSAWAWVDLAMWDLAGKLAATSIGSLLGRTRESVPVLATYPPRHRSASGYVDEVESLRDLGFVAIKLHPGNLDVKDVASAVLAARNQVGEDIDLVLDANNSYDLSTALSVGETLDEANFAWFEDPIPASRIGGVDQLLHSIRTPIALGDESSVLLREGCHLMIEHDLPIIRTSSRKLGITGSAKLATIAEALDRRCEIGVGGNPSANSANLSLAAAATRGHYEHWLPAHGHNFAAETVLEPLSDGSIRPLSGNGLGIVLDEDWIDGHRVDRIEIRH